MVPSFCRIREQFDREISADTSPLPHDVCEEFHTLVACLMRAKRRGFEFGEDAAYVQWLKDFLDNRSPQVLSAAHLGVQQHLIQRMLSNEAFTQMVSSGTITADVRDILLRGTDAERMAKEWEHTVEFVGEIRWKLLQVLPVAQEKVQEQFDALFVPGTIQSPSDVDLTKVGIIIAGYKARMSRRDTLHPDEIDWLMTLESDQLPSLVDCAKKVIRDISEEISSGGSGMSREVFWERKITSYRWETFLNSVKFIQRDVDNILSTLI